MSNDSRDEENMKPLTWDELAELYDANVGDHHD